MAGTDHTRELILGGPAVILVNPQLGENIGAAARAMLNFGLCDLRLVKPRDGWPNERAVATASGAEVVVNGAKLFDTTREAIADLQHVYASTARVRDMTKDVYEPRAAAGRLRQHSADGERAGILFGAERAGLANEDIAKADAVIAVPANPGFASLNLGQAVVVVAYEWFQATNPNPHAPGESVKATSAQVLDMFDHLEGELDARGFLFPKAKRPRMVRNLRNMFHRAGLTDQDVRTMRGIIHALAGTKGRPKGG